MKKYTILKQLCNLIPGHLVNRLAKEHGVDKKCRTFDEWSHVAALIPDFAIGKCAADAPACRAQTAAAQAGGGAGAAV